MTDKFNDQYDPSDINESGIRHWKLKKNGKIFTEEMIGKNKAFVYELIFPPVDGEMSKRYIGYKTIKDDGKWKDYLGSSDQVAEWLKNNNKSRIQRVILSLHGSEDSAIKEEKKLHKSLNVYKNDRFFNSSVYHEKNVKVDGKTYPLNLYECMFIGDSYIDEKSGYDEFVIGMNIPLGVILLTINIINIKDHPESGKITSSSFRWKQGFWKFYKKDGYYYGVKIPEKDLPSTDIEGADDYLDYIYEWTPCFSCEFPSEIKQKYEKEQYKLSFEFYNDEDTDTCAVKFALIEFQDISKAKSKVINSMEFEIPGYRCFIDDSVSETIPQWIKIRSI